MPTTPTSRCQGSSRSSKTRWPSPLLRPCSAWPRGHRLRLGGRRTARSGGPLPTPGNRRRSFPCRRSLRTERRRRMASRRLPDLALPPTVPRRTSLGLGVARTMSRPPRPPAPTLERLTGDERGQLLGERSPDHLEEIDPSPLSRRGPRPRGPPGSVGQASHILSLDAGAKDRAGRSGPTTGIHCIRRCVPAPTGPRWWDRRGGGGTRR